MPGKARVVQINDGSIGNVDVDGLLRFAVKRVPQALNRPPLARGSKVQQSLCCRAKSHAVILRESTQDGTLEQSPLAGVVVFCRRTTRHIQLLTH